MTPEQRADDVRWIEGQLRMYERDVASARGGHRWTEIAPLEREAARYRRILAEIAVCETTREALRFYADPYTYHLEILGPCGLVEDQDDFDGGSFSGRGRERRCALPLLTIRVLPPTPRRVRIDLEALQFPYGCRVGRTPPLTMPDLGGAVLSRPGATTWVGGGSGLVHGEANLTQTVCARKMLAR